MKRLLSRRWLKLSAGLVFFLLIALLVTAWYTGIWSWRDLEVFKQMSRECHPVWKDLHWGRVQVGQDVEEVIAATKPLRVERYGEFVQLNYQDGQGLSFTGVTITAERGRLASATAWSCTWHRTFFDELAGEDWERFSEAYEAHWRPLREKQLADENDQE